MINKRFVTAATAAAFMSGFAGLSCAALPQGGVTITPASEWTVSPIALKSDTGASFCSMKTSYRNGQMLVFGRDNQGNNSIAVDFSRDIFEIGQSYNVQLQSGRISRDIQALASSRQILVLQTGVDTVLYTALHNKHALSLSVQKTKYAFDLDPSAADALTALGRCSDALRGGTSFDETHFQLGKTQEAPLPESGDDTGPIQAADNSDENAMPAEPAPAVEQEYAVEAPRKAPLKKSAHKDGTQKESARPGSASEDRELAALRAQNAALMAENAKAREKLGLAAATAAPSSVTQAQAPITSVPAPKAPVARPIVSSAAPASSIASTPAPALHKEDIHEDIQAELAARAAQKTAPPASDVSITPTTGKAQASASIAQADARTVTSPASDLRALLVASNVVQPADLKASDNAGNTLRWMVDDIYGSAQTLPLAKGKTVTDMAQSYIRQMKGLCKGDFAQNLGAVKKTGAADAVEADVTCIDGKNDAAAAVLFLHTSDKFAVITQEGTPDQLSTAMSNRDAIILTAAQKSFN